MAIADVTLHAVAAFPKYRYDEWMGCWPAQVGNSQQINFTGGPAHTASAAEEMIARVVSDTNCRIAVGVNVSATLANSRLVTAKVVEAVHVPVGHRISVMAQA